ncbi:MAG: hypothetical protein K2I93_06420 [Oscillospiraceae bacterium]|nr:hypothetical protein [Oscillospiraceae bacterium]
MKKHMRYARLTALVLSGLLAFCLTACDDEMMDTFESVTEPESEEETDTPALSPEELASEIMRTTIPIVATEAKTETVASVSETTAPVSSAVETAVPGETTVTETNTPGSEPTDVTVFGVSAFLGKSTDGTERYFLFNTPLSGSCIAQQDGSSVALTYVPQEENMILFDMGGTVSRAEMSRIDADIIMLLWDNGVTETLTKMPNDPNEPFVFFSTDDLCQRALVYYEQKTGYRPSQVGAMLQVDGTVAIQLYDNLVDHNTTSDWYTIDRYTGIGTNTIGETIDLSQVVLE